VLDACRWRLAGGGWSHEVEVLKADQAVRRTLGLEPRGGEMLQPWFTGRHGASALAHIDAAYGFEIRDMPTDPVDLVVETAGLLAVTVNGTSIPLPEAPEHWIDVCFARLPVPDGILRIGHNEMSVTTAYNEGIGLEAIYLLGSFGVATSEGRVAITKLPEVLAPGDLCLQGLPFYGGAIALTLPLPAEAIDAARAGGSITLRTPRLSAACAFAMHAGAQMPDTASLALEADAPPTDARHMLAWDPYEVDVSDAIDGSMSLDLHVYLTRRNTFGPLHQVPREAPSYGPGNWVTEGQAFSPAHVLWPSGLLEAPQIVVQTGAEGA